MENYLWSHPIPDAPVATTWTQVLLKLLQPHAAWVKGKKESCSVVSALNMGPRYLTKSSFLGLMSMLGT
ncbi:hypothetical protein Tco_0993102 [Tanacetum coccineum]|uniref:Uncharacterized protein n=1 Tax=Tanacetum coccineum TaxID=301880 RepID=A0ABQ5F3Z3_9ASTR